MPLPPLLERKILHFHTVFGEHLLNRRLAPLRGFRPVWEILYPLLFIYYLQPQVGLGRDHCPLPWHVKAPPPT